MKSSTHDQVEGNIHKVEGELKEIAGIIKNRITVLLALLILG